MGLRHKTRTSSSNKAILGAILYLLAGISTESLAWLCRGNAINENIYVVDDKSKAAFHPIENQLPWPVLLALGTFSKKHIFMQKPSLVDRARTLHSFSQWAKKVGWAWCFRHAEERSIPPTVYKKTPGMYRGTLAPEVVAYIAAMRSTMSDFISRVNMKAADPRLGIPTFYKYAIRWLQGRNLEVHPSDKDGVLAVVSRETMLKLVATQFSSSKYTQVGIENVQDTFRLLRPRLDKLARRLQGLGHEEWSHQLRTAHACATSSELCCPSTFTIKTHKPPGKLEVRVLHSSKNNVLTPLSLVLDLLLRPVVAGVSLLCHNTDGVQQRIRRCCIGEHACLVKLDIKDFYMSGDQETMIRECSRQFQDRELSKFVGDALAELLASQFVAGRGSIYRASKGSGMGMPHSPNVCNLTFWAAVEAPVLDGNWDELGLLLYVRYHDDILAIFKSPWVARAFIEKLRRKASPAYVIEVDCASLTRVEMLDIEVYKTCDKSGIWRLEYRPYVKPTACHIPLHASSVHACSIHRAWPLAEIKRMSSRSILDSDFQHHRMMKLERFAWHFMPEPILQACRQYNGRGRLCSSALSRLGSVPPGPICRAIYFVLPYNPRLEGLQRALRETHQRWKSVLAQASLFIEPKVSFKSGGIPLYLRLRRSLNT